jgi:CHAD domain-containing protein
VSPLSERTSGEEISGPEKGKVFWWDFSPGRVRDRMSTILSVRALCPLFQVVGLKKSLYLYNKDGKIVLRMFLHTGEIRTPSGVCHELSPLLQFSAVRGYQKPFRQGVKLLGDRGAWKPLEQESFFQLALAMVHRHAGDYSSKFSVLLTPGQTMNQAISVIGLQLHQAMERNLPGVLEDIDTEFLHDFRVAIRRTRSALSQFKKMLPPGQCRVFSDEFRWLGSATGAVRDIDVCLKKEAAFREMLPESRHRGLDLLIRDIRRRRKTALAKMQKNLRSVRTTDLLTNWREFMIGLPEDIYWPAGQVSCSKTAEKVVGKCFRRLLNYDALILNGEEADSAMHRLRIQGKKFRYLIEFFRSLFCEEATVRLLKEMKGLQDDLGDFNDMSVQIDRFIQDLSLLSKNSPIYESLAGLVEALDARKKRLRKRCLKRCKTFHEKEKPELLKEMLAGKKDSSVWEN